MLNDEHLKVINYFSDSKEVFDTVDIKGGVAIMLRNSKQIYGAIKTFGKYKIIDDIFVKVKEIERTNEMLDSLISSRGLYRFTPTAFNDFPDISKNIGLGTGNMIASNALEKLEFIFHEVKKNETDIKIYGRKNNSRTNKFISKEYLLSNEYTSSFNVVLPEANGKGEFGETLSSPFVIEPNEGVTDTFISIGVLNTYAEASNLLRYVKSKFLRCLLGIKKATHHTPKNVWVCVPLQDFTEKSDIDWTKSIPEIDQQLYEKYKLTDEEIAFIDKMIKPME